ncbi:S41 family peptidase [uncultured Caulobacter sp.]|uniref:S41 family peptidase n=1 Tax=uncultured Caulobacter sp. TaxID=158749 RepID=UPI00262D480D|nr:S41 family peptidase [uncultured Caulobacter sp.]
MTGFLSAVLAAAALTSAAPAYDAAAWRADFARMRAELQARYANLAWMGSYESGIDTPSLVRRTEIALDAAHGDAEAREALRAFVAGFHDGHLSELPTLEARTTASPEPDRPTLDPDDPASGCAAIGYASTASVAFSVPFESLPGFRLIGDGQDSIFRVGLAEVGGRRIGLVRLQTFRARAFPMACRRAWAKARAAGTPITRSAIVEATGRLWLSDLAEQLKALRAAGARAVIVDVGGNPGGDDSGDWIARLFAARPIASSRLLVVDAPEGAGYLDEEIDDLTDALAAKPAGKAKADLEAALAAFKARKASLGAQPCDLSWVWRERRAWRDVACRRLVDAGYADGPLPGLPPHAYGDARAERALAWSTEVQDLYGAWPGPTYVLTDRRSFSAAEMFAATMRNNGAAKIVGVRTGGDGCGFMGDTPPVVLPHSRLRFRVPNCVRLRADGTNEVAGIAPDLPVEPAEGESDRARAARVLRTVTEDLSP